MFTSEKKKKIYIYIYIYISLSPSRTMTATQHARGRVKISVVSTVVQCLESILSNMIREKWTSKNNVVLRQGSFAPQVRWI